MPTTMPMSAQGQTTLNAQGAGSVTLSPGIYGVTWHLTQANVRTVQATVTNESTAQLESFPYSLPGTQTGSSGDTTGLDLELSASQQIKCTWAGGDAGAVALFTVTGTKTVP